MAGSPAQLYNLPTFSDASALANGILRGGLDAGDSEVLEAYLAARGLDDFADAMALARGGSAPGPDDEVTRLLIALSKRDAGAINLVLRSLKGWKAPDLFTSDAEMRKGALAALAGDAKFPAPAPQNAEVAVALAADGKEVVSASNSGGPVIHAAASPVRENITNYLEVNFGTPEFAEAWDDIGVGPANLEFLRRASDALDPDFPRVLDLGTGTGKALLPTTDHFRRGLIVGVDRAQEMLAFARAKFARKYPLWMRAFAMADVERLDEELPPELAPFDAVSARYLFNFIGLDTVLPQVLNRLKAGGILTFNVFGGFYWGYTDDYTRANPFEEARIRVAKEVLEEMVLPGLADGQRAELVEGGHIRASAGGGWEIISPPVTQKSGLIEGSLEESLARAGFENIIIGPVPEQYPAEERFRSSLLTKSLPYWWAIMNMIKDDMALRIRVVQGVISRMPRAFRSGEHTFTEIFVSARRPPGGNPSTPAEMNFLRSTARLLAGGSPGAISGARADIFYQLLTANPDTFAAHHAAGNIAFGWTPDDEVYRDYGQEVKMVTDARNIYAFLEPILAYILSEPPDTILIVDDGAAPFRPFVERFLREFGLDIPIRSVKFSAQSGGQGVLDAYQLLNPLKEGLAGRRVLIIDDNAVRVKTGSALVKALDAHGAAGIKYAVVSAFNKRAQDFADLAVVRLPGDSMWIDPNRGIVNWTAWEETGSAGMDDGWFGRAMGVFAEALSTNRVRLEAGLPLPINRTPVRERLPNDGKMLIDLLYSDSTDQELTEFMRAQGIRVGGFDLGEIFKAFTIPQVSLPALPYHIRPGYDVRFLIRQYLQEGRESLEKTLDGNRMTYQMLDGERFGGSIRFATIDAPDGSRSLVLERLDPEHDFNFDPDLLLRAAIEIGRTMVREQGYSGLLVSGRDILFSKSGPVRTRYNAQIKPLPESDLWHAGVQLKRLD